MNLALLYQSYVSVVNIVNV